jgi:hypothetical protein
MKEDGSPAYVDTIPRALFFFSAPSASLRDLFFLTTNRRKNMKGKRANRLSPLS